MLPALQQMLNGSSPWAVRMRESCSVSARRPMQVAMPIFFHPMSRARATVSSTRVQRGVTVPFPAVFW
jgi:hypothetical protein